MVVALSLFSTGLVRTALLGGRSLSSIPVVPAVMMSTPLADITETIGNTPIVKISEKLCPPGVRCAGFLQQRGGFCAPELDRGVERSALALVSPVWIGA